MLPPLSNLDDTFEEEFAATLRYCKTEIPFYRARWGTLDPAKEFDAIEILDKSQVRRHHADFLNRKLTTRYLLHTSGTTGDPLLIPRSREEVDFVNDVFESLSRKRDQERPLGSRPVGVSIRDNVHGFGPAYRSDIFWVGDPSFTPPTLELAEQYLLRRIELPGCDERVTSIFMSLLEILHFTEFVHQRGLDIGKTSVKAVYSTGFPTCSSWNDRISRYWRCRHINVFSLAEVFGQALSCDQCGAYHWDAFSVVEFLDPNNRRPVEEGLASLIVTTLYPYTQLMPLVRYDTGDLVSVSRHCPSGVGFTPLGRKARALLLFSNTLVPFDADILEALADCRWVKRLKPFVLEKLTLAGTETFGMPEVAIQVSGQIVTLTIVVADGASMPTVDEINKTTLALRDACRRAVLRVRASAEDIDVRVEIKASLGHLASVFGCATAGLPEN